MEHSELADTILLKRQIIVGLLVQKRKSTVMSGFSKIYMYHSYFKNKSSQNSIILHISTYYK